MLSHFINVACNSPFKVPIAICEEFNENKQLVETREIQSAAVNSVDACKFGSVRYFTLCGVGGILSCGATHLFIVPLDLVKCRLQVNPLKYKNLFNGFKVTVRLLELDFILFILDLIYIYTYIFLFKGR